MSSGRDINDDETNNQIDALRKSLQLDFLQKIDGHSKRVLLNLGSDILGMLDFNWKHLGKTYCRVPDGDFAPGLNFAQEYVLAGQKQANQGWGAVTIKDLNSIPTPPNWKPKK